MIHSTSVFRRSFLYVCILGAFSLASCTSCEQKNVGPLGPKGDPGLQEAAGKLGADENKGPDREEKAETELKLELVFGNLTSTTAQGSPSTDCFKLTLKNNGSKTIQLAKLKLGYTADLVLTYQGGHKTGDAHQDQFIIVQAGSRNDVHNKTLQELTGQAELAVGESVTIKNAVKTGEAVDSAVTQLKVTETEANETRASQAFNFAKQRTPAKDERKLPEDIKNKSNNEIEEKGSDDLSNLSNTHNVTPGELSSQAELAVGESVTIKNAVKTGEVVDSAVTQLKVTETEANETQASQAFNFAKQRTPAKDERKLPEDIKNKSNNEIEEKGSDDLSNLSNTHNVTPKVEDGRAGEPIASNSESTSISVSPCSTESSSEVGKEANYEDTPSSDETSWQQEVMKRFFK